MMLYWLSVLCYIVFSQVVVTLSALPILITIGVAFALCIVGFGILAWKVGRGTMAHERKVEQDTTTLPTPRAAKMRGKYLQ